MAKEGGMQAGLFVIIGLILSWGLGPPPVVAADMSLTGKLTISVTGREQALFEKASVKFEKLHPRVRVRFAATDGGDPLVARSEEHTSELQSRPHLVCRLLLEKKKPIQSSTRCIEAD